MDRRKATTRLRVRGRAALRSGCLTAALGLASAHAAAEDLPPLVPDMPVVPPIVLPTGLPAPWSSPSPAPASPPPAAPPAEAPRSSTGLRDTGVAFTVIGTIGLATSAGIGWLARSKYHESDAHCVVDACDAAGLGLRDDAQRRAKVATIVGIAGGGVLLSGLVMWIAAPTAYTGSASSGLRVGLSPMGVLLAGSF